jgi:catechol 2,3-dioxygenase-like lactoylglutathione lyase family enzyme
VLQRLDHLVLTARDRDRRVDVRTRGLGLTLETFGSGRLALRPGSQKINLHEAGRELEPRARVPAPGALDPCFLAAVPLAEVIRRLGAAGVAIEVGPIRRTGAVSAIRSVWVRDPDSNLIEIGEPA